MKKWISLILVGALTLTLAACGKSAAEPAAPANSSGEGAGTGKDIVIDILWQQEVTEPFMDYAVAKMQEKYPDITINLNISPEAYSEINNLMASKNAPDIFFSWASDVDLYGMYKDGMLNPVDDVLAMNTAEGDETLKDRLLQAGLDLGNWEGSHYLLPLTQYVAANFYDNAFLAAQGIDPAALATMDGFKAACAQLHSEGVTPMVYGGAYAFMVHDSFIYPLIVSKDPAAAEALNKGEKGAWMNPSVVAAVEEWQKLVDAGYVTPNSIAMDHIQSQIEFINHKAAFIPVGTWLEGEMGDQWPEGFELMPFAVPTEDGKPVFTPIIEVMILPKQATDANLPYVAELLQYFYSQENAAKCLEETGALMAFQNVSEEMKAMLPGSVQATLALQQNAVSSVASYRLTNKKLFAEITNAVNALSVGEIDAKAFCERLDALAVVE